MVDWQGNSLCLALCLSVCRTGWLDDKYPEPPQHKQIIHDAREPADVPTELVRLAGAACHAPKPKVCSHCVFLASIAGHGDVTIVRFILHRSVFTNVLISLYILRNENG